MPVQAPPAPATTSSGSRARLRHLPRPDVLAAVLTWVVGLAVAVLVVRWADLDPFTVGGAIMPVAVGMAVGGVLLLVFVRRPSRLLVGVAAGLYAAWTGLAMASSLNGTRYGFGALGGDEGRLLAQATKYTTAVLPVDAFVRHLPTEYPPLFPWVLGHLAQITGRPAWTLEGRLQIIAMSGAIVLAYCLWRRLVSAPTALLIVALVPVVFEEPSKDYEFLTLLIIVPWAIATFVGPTLARGRLHWLPAGVIGGIIVTSYPAYLVFAGLGLIAMVWFALREPATRRAYLLHLVGVVATAFVVASWYVIPFVVGSLTHHGNRISDMFLANEIVHEPLPLFVLDPTPLGLLQLAGLLGMIWYRRSTWWARPLLVMTAGAFVYRAVFLLNTVHNNHTGYSQYTARFAGMTLATAGVLAVAESLPRLTARLGPLTRRHQEVAAVAAAVVIAWAAIQGWQQWTPGPRGGRDASTPVAGRNLATESHSQPLPNGQLPRYAAPGTTATGFPSDAVADAVRADLGQHARPILLSYDQRLFAFYDFYAYLPPSRLAANTLQEWDDRAAEIRALAGVHDPAAFAAASAHLRHGPIDVFVLHGEAGGTAWTWKDAQFDPAAFSSKYWHVRQVSDSTVVAVRLPGGRGGS